MGRLARAWADAVGELGGDAVRAYAVGDELEQAYRQPHRRYHTASHIAAVLRTAGRLGGQVGLDAGESACVALAACAHDVVYDGRSGADERASADWAKDRLARLGVAPAHIARVVALVLATADHEVRPDDLGASVLNDADLAILAAPSDEYAAYVDAVRFEYRSLSDSQWRAGRAAAMSALLDRPRLFATDVAFERWELAARRNLTAELDALAGHRDLS